MVTTKRCVSLPATRKEMPVMGSMEESSRILGFGRDVAEAEGEREVERCR
jgi:hypothetical protein